MATIGKYGKILFSNEDIQFIKDNFQHMTNQKIADILGLKQTIVRTKAYELGLQRLKLEFWSEAAVNYLRDNFRTTGNKEIAKHFNTHFPKNKNWCKRHISKKLAQLNLQRTPQDLYIIREHNRQLGSYGKPNPKLKRKPMPKLYYQLNSKTRIELKPGTDINKIKEKYQHYNINI